MGAKRTPIAVETLDLDEAQHPLEQLATAGRRLLQIDRDAFAKVLAAAHAFVSVHDVPGESDEAFAVRLRQVWPARQKGAN